jgi:predicted ATPase
VLTRIEIDGFKTFRAFELDLPPFLVVLGRNASGKSNLFDAIQFLRASAGSTLLEAAQQMRGDVLELFHHHIDGTRMDRMRFAVEVLVPSQVTDAFGDTAKVSHTRLRYELTIELRSIDRGGLRPYVADERVALIKRAADRWVRRIPDHIRGSVALYSGTRTVPLETEHRGGKSTFVLKTGSQGRPRLLPASEATATVLSSLSTAGEYPLLYALKQELQSWRLLQLDPATLRTPSSYDDPDALATNGAGLANALQRIADDTATDDLPEGVLPAIIADLAAVVPGMRDLRLIDDDVRRQRFIEVTMRGEAAYSARVASDGTLRALALLAALYDPRDSGLICFEEPENGMYPGRLVTFLAHLRDRVTTKDNGLPHDPNAT